MLVNGFSASLYAYTLCNANPLESFMFVFSQLLIHKHLVANSDYNGKFAMQPHIRKHVDAVASKGRCAIWLVDPSHTLHSSALP